MQTKAGIGAKTDNIAGIWRDFWFEQNDVKHTAPLITGGRITDI
jgi:hypothetical protein